MVHNLFRFNSNYVGSGLSENGENHIRSDCLKFVRNVPWLVIVLYVICTVFSINDIALELEVREGKSICSIWL
jgi:hypothetical protein